MPILLLYQVSLTLWYIHPTFVIVQEAHLNFQGTEDLQWDPLFNL
jgi:hypothetical protein